VTAKAIMLMGTGSNVGKSLIAAGLCRAYVRRGLKVMPFKPQNMSNNAAVTADGGEIGRAQALQARAAKVPASVHMNPILLKPETDRGAQVIVQGRRRATLSAREFFANRAQYLPAILESFQRLRSKADLVVVEGAGSPAEVNLRTGDLANMGFAHAANVPALLIGDIHRGGVIASIIGTLDVLEETDRRLINGFIINNFHGDISLFSEGQAFLQNKTSRPCLGVVPHFSEAARLPAEDALKLEEKHINNSNKSEIFVLRLPRIANFDDLDALQQEPSVTLTFLHPGQPIPASARLVVIPGSKSTIGDLSALRNEGWDIDLKAHVRRGGKVLGLCGGYQMLGRHIHDPLGIEGPAASVDGLGLLDVETTLTPDKTLREVTGTHLASGACINGYEIHLGETAGPDTARPFANLGGRPDGATSPSGLVEGTYLHGCFTSDTFRSAYLANLGLEASGLAYEQTIEETLDRLADHLETHLDLDRILELAR
jgi:adenosylcobyric acid synthase